LYRYGVAGVVRAQFWCHTPKELVGSVVVVAAPGADRAAVGLALLTTLFCSQNTK
jgi:hypothetical protein